MSTLPAVFTRIDSLIASGSPNGILPQPWWLAAAARSRMRRRRQNADRTGFGVPRERGAGEVGVDLVDVNGGGLVNPADARHRVNEQLAGSPRCVHLHRHRGRRGRWFRHNMHSLSGTSLSAGSPRWRCHAGCGFPPIHPPRNGCRREKGDRQQADLTLTPAASFTVLVRGRGRRSQRPRTMGGRVCLIECGTQSPRFGICGCGMSAVSMVTWSPVSMVSARLSVCPMTWRCSGSGAGSTNGRCPAS